MLCKEDKYKFREFLTTPNRDGICAQVQEVKKDSLSLYVGVNFVGGNGTVVNNAKKDFIDFLKVSAKVKNPENPNGVTVRFITDNDALGEFNQYKGRVITVDDDGITINAYDERGMASALFDLEILMEREKAPILEKRVIKNRPLFSPRMSHSAYDMDEFPNEYLLKLAKEGLDAIIIFIRGVDKNMLWEKVDYNDVIARANSFGLDVYAYCCIKNMHHPEEEGAEESYEEVYGKLFKAHKGLKGMVFVGESVEFPSKDEHVGGISEGSDGVGSGNDNIPAGKPSPGFWPCYDYPEWISLIKKCAEKYIPDIDLVFWTYNWAYAPEEDRIKLINNLPEGISLLVTYVVQQKYRLGSSVLCACDYTLSIATAGQTFISEAKAAKARNIRLYTMANTAGRTWDFGVIPYEPMPQQWKVRYDQMREFNTLYNLSGLMECHHYGLTPSFISRFEKYCFESGGDLTGATTTEEYLQTVMQEFFGKDGQAVLEALEYASMAIKNYVPADELQYGPMRISTAYPLCLRTELKPPERQRVYFGLIICNTLLRPYEYGRASIYSVRQRDEKKSLIRMLKHLDKSIELACQIENPELATEKLINLLKFMRCTVKTAINVKEFVRQRFKLQACEYNFKIKKIISKIKKIAKEEVENSLESIEYVEKDSALGYEVSMGYACSKERIEWKIRQVQFMIDSELGDLEKSLVLKKNYKQLNKF